MNMRTNTAQNRYDHSTSDQINWPTVGQVQPQLPPPLITSFQPSWFPPPQYSFMSVVDLSDIPNLRRLALRSDLSSRIVSQIEYYFSDENLVRDDYLKSLMDNQGWVDVFFIAEFRRIRGMTDDIDLILRSMGSSTTVEVQVFRLRKRHGWERWIL
ncbi:hypothetical protein Rs2_33972 [Raphanus sativus]|uniref:La-related protein 1A-like n=1 Tax=Raphanus sativus TaxID=3726 RepID=A0A9W3C4K4_RAPSA|nr:la-related protein 1A-like [Raphanus sativus]KAJ4883879.1 hypothetical protein Rs2_33972 [Raphanus sativus]